jgi:Flp pilus assembly protein TadB
MTPDELPTYTRMVGDERRPSARGRLRAAYRFWSTDERFAWGARYQFVVMCPVAAIAAIALAVVGAWLPAVVFAIAAVYMGHWLVQDRRRDRE